MTDFIKLRKEKELIKLRESARYSWREELSEKTDHPYVDVMPNEKTGEEKKSKKKEQKIEEVYKGKHGQTDKQYADSRSQGGKMVSGDSKMSGAEYTHGRRVKAENPGMQPDVGGKTKPKSQGKMDNASRADLEYRKANLKAQEAKKKAVKEEALEEGAFKDQYGKKGKLSQSSERKSLGRGSSIKDGAKPTGYESKSEFRDAAKKFSLKPNTKFRTEEKEKPTAMDLVKQSLPKDALIDTTKKKKEIPWHQKHLRKDPTPNRYDKKND